MLLLAMTEHAEADPPETKADVHPKVAEVIDKEGALVQRPRSATRARRRCGRRSRKHSLRSIRRRRSGRRRAFETTTSTTQRRRFRCRISRRRSRTLAGLRPPTPKGDSPKPSLWVHTKATPPEPPKPPRKKNALVPILAASGALALLCVGIAYGLPRWRSDAHAAASASASSGAIALADDDAGDDDDGGDEIEIDDDAMVRAPSVTTTAKPQTTAKPAATTGKPKPKIKRTPSRRRILAPCYGANSWRARCSSRARRSRRSCKSR